MVTITRWHGHMRTFHSRHERMRGWMLREYRQQFLPQHAPEDEPGAEHRDDACEPEANDPTLI